MFDDVWNRMERKSGYLVPGAEVLRPAVGDALPELSGHVRRGHQGG